MKHKNILVPLDGSSWSNTIVPTLCALFDPTHDHVTLLRVAEEPVGVGQMPDPPFMDVLVGANMYTGTTGAQHVLHPIYDTQVIESRHAELEDALQLAAHPLRAAGFTVAIAVRFGDPAEEIVAVTKGQTIDLVAMTTHGRTGVRRALLGSVAEQVMRSIEVPVLLLRPTAQPMARPSEDVAYQPVR